MTAKLMMSPCPMTWVSINAVFGAAGRLWEHHHQWRPDTAGNAATPKYEVYEGLPDIDLGGGEFPFRFGGNDDNDNLASSVTFPSATAALSFHRQRNQRPFVRRCGSRHYG